MNTITLYNKSMEMPISKKDQSFKEYYSLGLYFKLIISKLDLKLDFNVYNLRLIVNESISTTLDVREDILSEQPLKIETILLSQLFSSKVSKEILNSIK